MSYVECMTLNKNGQKSTYHSSIRVNTRGGRGCITVCPFPKNSVLPFNWAFENQPIASGILIQPSRYKRVESNLLADKRVSNRGNQVFVWLYRSIFIDL